MLIFAVCRKYLLLLPLAIVARHGHAQRTRPEFVHNYRTLITANVPTYIHISKWPGIAFGLTVEQIFGIRHKFSAALSAYQGWGGSLSSLGKIQKGQERTKLKMKLLQPAAFWHPDDNRLGITFGLSLPVGTLYRYSIVGTGNSNSLFNKIAEESTTFFGLLGHVHINTFSRRNSTSVTVISIAGGSILSAGSTSGAIVELGVAFGGAF